MAIVYVFQARMRWLIDVASLGRLPRIPWHASSFNPFPIPIRALALRVWADLRRLIRVSWIPLVTAPLANDFLWFEFLTAVRAFNHFAILYFNHRSD